MLSEMEQQVIIEVTEVEHLMFQLSEALTFC